MTTPTDIPNNFGTNGALNRLLGLVSTPPTAPPAQPATVTISNVTATAADVAWDAVSGADTYTLTLLPSGFTVTGLTGTTFQVLGLTPNRPYSVMVAAVKSGVQGNSTSATFTTAKQLPDPATNFAAPEVLTTSVRLTWTYTQGASEATALLLERSLDQGSTWTTITNSLDPTLTTFTDTGLTPNTRYVYRLTATNISGASTPVTVTATTAALPAPTGLVAQNVQSTGAQLKWDSVQGATSYNVRVTPGTFTQTVTQAECPVTGLTANTAYTAYVAAVNADGTGVEAKATFTTKAALAGFASSNVTDTSATVTWTGAGDAASYTVDWIVKDSNGTPSEETVTAATADLGSLTASTTYTVTVTADSGEQGTFEFTTAASGG